MLGNSQLLNLWQETLEKGNFLRLRALGGSMFPFIKPGDIITARRVPPENITVGQILFYYKDGNFFAHRLKARGRDSLMITRGDNMPFNDNLVTPSEVLGKVVMIERRGRQIDMESGLMQLVNWAIPRIPIYWIAKSMFFGGRIKRALQRTFH